MHDRHLPPARLQAARGLEPEQAAADHDRAAAPSPARRGSARRPAASGTHARRGARARRSAAATAATRSPARSGRTRRRSPSRQLRAAARSTARRATDAPLRSSTPRSANHDALRSASSSGAASPASACESRMRSYGSVGLGAHDRERRARRAVREQLLDHREAGHAAADDQRLRRAARVASARRSTSGSTRTAVAFSSAWRETGSSAGLVELVERRLARGRGGARPSGTARTRRPRERVSTTRASSVARPRRDTRPHGLAVAHAGALRRRRDGARRTAACRARGAPATCPCGSSCATGPAAGRSSGAAG